MAEMPWLSVIVPTHEGERWLAETLGSIAQDGVPGIECLLIDSSSGDGTRRLAEGFADRLDLRIHHRPDLDNWRAKTNAGFREARAPHVSMLHQDDYWLPGRAGRVRGWIRSRPEAAMLLHAARYVDEGGRPLGALTCPLPANRPITAATVLPRLLVQNFIAVPTPVIRRDAFLDAGGIDEALWYTGDWDLYLKLCRAGPVVYHDAELSAFRIHGASLTASGSAIAPDFRAQHETVLARHADALPAARRAEILARARAAIGMNASLAGAHHGDRSDLAAALLAVARLGPVGLGRFLRDTRIVARTLPRLRARAAGRL